MPDRPPPLDDDELKLLHEMIRDFDRARWLRGQLKIWVMWFFGLPAAVLGIIQIFETLAKSLKGGP